MISLNITIHDGPNTRWLCGQADVIALVRDITQNICSGQTEGELPLVRVAPNHCRCEICEAKADEKRLAQTQPG